MTQFLSQANLAQSLNGKVVVLSGGAKGIGADFVRLCCQNGASVCFGDIDDEAGALVAAEVNRTSTASPPKAIFAKTDVTKYDSVLDLFDLALKTFGRVDCAVANAGIVERGNWFDPALDLKSIREPATNAVVDINLLGVLYFTRIACVYLRQDASNAAASSSDKSIILISSVAGFKESPGLFVYQTTKHGVLGLMRSLRLYLPPAWGIRINAVCPWMTATGMVSGIEGAWNAAKLPINTPMDVAVIMAQIASEASMNGKAVYVEGGRGWEIEENLDKLEPLWLGEEPSRSLAAGQKALGSGMDWAQ